MQKYSLPARRENTKSLRLRNAGKEHAVELILFDWIEYDIIGPQGLILDHDDTHCETVIFVYLARVMKGGNTINFEGELWIPDTTLEGNHHSGLVIHGKYSPPRGGWLEGEFTFRHKAEQLTVLYQS